MTRRAWILFAAVSVLWGIPYLLIKVAVDDGISPTFLAWVRCMIGTAVLLPFAWRLGALRGLGERWRPLVAFSAVELALAWPLLGAGEKRVSSSLAAILIATVPLIVALMSLRLDTGERLGRAQLTGMLVGFAGVVALLGVDVAGKSSELVGAALILGTAVCYAAGPIIVSLKLADLHPLGPVTGALGIAALLTAPFALTSVPDRTPSTDALLSVAALGLLCSAIAFFCFFALVAEAGPSRASIITYVNPVIAVALGVTLLDEHLGAGAIAGLALILAGSWLATGGKPPSAEPEPILEPAPAG